MTTIRAIHLFAAVVALIVPTAARAGGDWITFVDETATRISSDPSVGVSDIREKDMAVGDVDQDGDTDLVVVRKIPFTNPGGFRNVLFMNENGIMTDRSSTLAPDFLDATDDRDVELVDVDGDSWLDIVTAGTFNQQPRILRNLGQIGGVWQGYDWEPARLPTLLSPTSAGPKFCGLGVGDLTGDGRPELYFTDYENNLEDKLLINDGSGFFADQTSTRVPAGAAASVFGTDADIADMNGDGFNDIVKTNSSGNLGGPGAPVASILYNSGVNGAGQFTMHTINTDAPYMVAPADYTQDGRLDLFLVDDAQDRYLVNTGNDGLGRAQFTTTAISPSPNTNFFGGNITVADLDLDGILDIVVSDVDTDVTGCGRQLVILRGQGTPPNITYSDPLGGASRPWTTQGTFDVAVLDINNDGAPDLWIGTCTGTKVFMGVPISLFDDGFETGDTSAWSLTVN